MENKEAPAPDLICCVKHCEATKAKFPDLAFFSLPTDQKLRKVWLAAIGRKDIMMPKKSHVEKHLVCAKHFSAEFIVKAPKKRMLYPEIMPTKRLPNQTQESNESSSSSDLDLEFNDPSDISDTSEISDEDDEIKTGKKKQQHSHELKRKLAKELKSLKNKRNKLDNDISIINQELKEVNKLVISQSHESNIFRRFATLFDWLHENSKNKTSNVFQDFALYLYYTCPQAYKFLKTILELPSRGCLKTIKLNLHSSYSLTEAVLNIISLKLKSLPDKAKYCVICIDEIPFHHHEKNVAKGINRTLEVQDCNKTKMVVGSAYVITLQGIFYDWKQPVAYTFQGTTKNYKDLNAWIDRVISVLFSIGIHVKAIVSISDSDFDKFATDKNGKQITIANPFFYVDNVYKVYYIFDVCNLLKHVRNLLMENYLSKEGEAISWLYIVSLYEDQVKNNLKLIPKITGAHINPNAVQKLELKYVVEVFSRPMYAALRTYINFGRISKKASKTADFVKSMRDLIDLLHPRKFKTSKAQQKAYTNSKENVKLLQSIQTMFADMKCVDQTTQATTTVSLFRNMQITIQSVQQLFRDLEKEGFDHLFTKRLSLEESGTFFKELLSSNNYGRVRTADFTRAYLKARLSCMLENSPLANQNSESNLYDILFKAECIMNVVKKSYIKI